MSSGKNLYESKFTFAALNLVTAANPSGIIKSPDSILGTTVFQKKSGILTDKPPLIFLAKV